MPRTSRASRGGLVYHVLNRGNGRNDVFHNEDDSAAFVNLMREAHEKVSDAVGWVLSDDKPSPPAVMAA